MAQENIKQSNPQQAASPLDTLANCLDEDMRAVNAEILRRMQSPVALIPQLATYLIAAGGKRIRPLLTLASTQIYGGNMTRAHGLSTSVEFIHTATLLHDDVVDESLERRGQEATNLVFGNQATVLVGDFLFARAFQLMTDDGSIDVLRVLSEASAVITEGEVLQLTTAGNLNASQDDYIDVIKAKTAALFAAACEVGPLVAGADTSAAQAMSDFGMNLGIAFQIADDALDYNANHEKLGKVVGDDFREGKMTLPIILALENATDDERAFWQRTIKDNTQTEGDLKTAQDILSKHDAIARTLKIAHDYGARAQNALDKAPDHNLKGLLSDLIPYTITREY